MKHLLLLSAALGLLGAPVSASAEPEQAVPPYSGEYRKRLLTITPEAQKMLDELAEKGRGYKPVSGRTHLLVRTQLKYGLERTDFLHNWYERPLYQDSRYGAGRIPGHWLNALSWKKQVEIGALSKLDGFAFFPATHGRDEAIAASVVPGSEFTLMPEMTWGAVKADGGVAFCERMIKMPNAFRIGGRTVFTYYGDGGNSILASFRKLRAAMDAKGLGDQVAFTPYSFVWDRHAEPGHLSPCLDAALLELGREQVRTVLRATDGFVFSLHESECARRFNPEFALKVILPVVHSVLMEDEFRGKKLFGITLTQGHENDYRWTYICDSVGTRTGRDKFAVAHALRPDFVICTEWDEEDENTHFRPTVSNGHVTQRILRYWADRYNGRAPEVFPGDDTTIPNLVLSYRKSLQAGEPLETEIVNIPDGTAPDDRWQVTLRWLTPEGRVAKEYAPTELDATTCGAVYFKTPVSALVANHVLVPELTVAAAGKTWTFATGFWPVNLEANRNYDYKWIREALREKPKSVTAMLNVSPVAPDGTMLVTGEATGAVPFRSVEVLEGPDTVYMEGADAPRLDEIALRISMQGVNESAQRNKLTGSIRILDAQGLVCTPVVQGAVQQKGDGWVLRGMPFVGRFDVGGPWARTFFARLSSASAERAEVVVDLPPVFSARVKVKDLLARDGFGFAGPAGAYLWIGRTFAPFRQNAPIGRKNVNFAFRLRPRDPNAVLRLQTVDENFRIWRGGVKSLTTASGRKTRFHVYERDARAVTELELDANRLTMLDYRFDGADGALAWGGPNRLLPMVFGGCVLPVTGIGAADGGGQQSPFRGSKFLADPTVVETAPTFVTEPEGFRSIRFGGYAYAGLGLQVLPQFAGFALELKLRPDDVKGRQDLLGTGNLGFELWLEDGVPMAYLNRATQQAVSRENRGIGATFTGPKLEGGKWQTLRFVTDQTEAYLEVDGVRGDVQRFGDWRWSPCALGFGRLGSSGLRDTRDTGFFRGRLGTFRVTPR